MCVYVSLLCGCSDFYQPNRPFGYILIIKDNPALTIWVNGALRTDPIYIYMYESICPRLRAKNRTEQRSKSSCVLSLELFTLPIVLFSTRMQWVYFIQMCIHGSLTGTTLFQGSRGFWAEHGKHPVSSHSQWRGLGEHSILIKYRALIY